VREQRGVVSALASGALVAVSAREGSSSEAAKALAATMVQSAWRGRQARREYAAARSAAATAQAASALAEARATALRQASAARIQVCTRVSLRPCVCVAVQRRVHAGAAALVRVVSLQAVFRGRCEWRSFVAVRRGVCRMQALVRCRRARAGRWASVCPFRRCRCASADLNCSPCVAEYLTARSSATLIPTHAARESGATACLAKKPASP
jgi:hypothetical protein